MRNNELIETYLHKILHANESINLTSITSLHEAKILHIEDSLVGLQELEAAPQGLYGDLGSGGGFPGVPLAISSGRKTVLVDSVRKKMTVVSSIIKELGLCDKISVYSGRIEDLARDYPEKFSVLTARALSKLSILMELASPLLMTGGVLICYKANISDDEWEHALSTEQKLGLEFSSDRYITLSDNETQRRLVCFKKVKQPQIKLPRHVGYAQKKPL